jgi:hypothetical protein
VFGCQTEFHQGLRIVGPNCKQWVRKSSRIWLQSEEILKGGISVKWCDQDSLTTKDT